MVRSVKPERRRVAETSNVSAGGIESREGCGLWLEPSEAALRPHETLHRSGQHEEIGLSIRRVILNDLFRRDPDQESFNHAYQVSSGYWPLEFSTLNFVCTVSPAPQQESDLGSDLR